VTTDPERIDQFLNPGRLVDGVAEVDRDVGGPVDRVVGDAQRREDVLVERLLPGQQFVNLLEELARTGTLNDAVVIGGGEGDGLADGQVDEGAFARALELGRVIEGTGADDAALALHQARNRVLGSDTTRVGQ
jgi:hypothetical protein